MAYTTIDNPELYFQTKLYTGDGSTTQAQTFDGSEDMAPDLVWIKSRSNAEAHSMTDNVRGVTKWLESDSTAAEQTNANTMKAFGTDGFSVGLAGSVGDTSQTYVAWCWKGGTTSGKSTTSETITPSGYSINATSGFGVFTWSGSGSNGTITHGLGGDVSKGMILVKRLNSTAGWQVYHQGTGATHTIYLNSTAVADDSDTVWNDTAPTSSVFTLGTNAGTNASGGTYVGYVFAPKQGFSKFGKYTGNANAEGTYVYTGFSPSFVMAKMISGTGNWNTFDNKRTDSGAVGGNVIDKRIKNNDSAAEIDGSANRVDFLANGFKWRGTDDDTNVSSGTFIYMAFAESPFVNSNGVPSTAR